MLITVFTPTYNRRELLTRAYNSLLNQTSKNFCWLIVDDGSEDDTSAFVRQWMKDEKIAIQYIYCENGGKMRAHNIGVAHAATTLFFCLDSDDYLVENAIELIAESWEDILRCGLTDKNKVAGVVAHKGKSPLDTLSGSQFPDVDFSTLRGLYQRGFKGETTLIFRTDILKSYLFPEISGEKYVPEDYIYDKIDEEYILKVMPRILTICELRNDGYTDCVQKLRDENPVAWYLYYEQRARITEVSLLKLKYISHYICFSWRLNRKIFAETTLPHVFLILGIPGALLLRLLGKR